MKPMRRLLAVAPLLCLVHCSPQPGEPVRPNIIFMLTDDQGWQDTSLPLAAERTPLNERYHTPHLERLAAQGVKFTNAYSNTVCTPTRVAFMTGLHQARTRVSNWTHLKDTPTDHDHPELIIPRWNMNGLQPVPNIPNSVHAKTLPQELRNAGYRTIHIGKGHLGAGGTPGEDPQVFGFDVRIGGRFSGGCGSYYGTHNFAAGGDPEKTPWRAWDMDEYFGQDIYLTEALTREAVKAVKQAVTERQPFFLYLAHYAPHARIMPDKRFVQRYLDAGLSETEAAYASMLEGVDQSLGDLMDLAEDLRIADNTVIFFASDNGGLSHAQRDGEPHTHNAPLNSGKGSAYEGGIRVPLVVKWPGVARPGSVAEVPVIIHDLFPTLLEIAGVEFGGQSGVLTNEEGTVELGPELDGRSFVPLLRGEAGDPERPLFWHFPHAWGGLSSATATGPGIGATSTVRKGDWKLVYWHADGRKELFNLRSDLGETNNLAAAEPTKTAELSAALGSFLRRTNAVMPTLKKTGRPAPYPDEL